MKKYIALLFFPVLVNAQMHITTIEQVSQLLKPDVLQGSLGFEGQSKNPTIIKTDFNAIVAEVKRFDSAAKYCKGGGYYLSPMYDYKNQKPEFTGYSGNLNFNCEFNTIEDYNALSEKIDKVSASGVHKTQGALSWGVSAKAQIASKQELRSALLKTAASQASLFSKETGLICEVATVNFDGMPQPRPMMMRAMAIADSVPTQSPIQSDEESTLSATVVYECGKK
jgi:uncharacterized protein YggE